MRKVICLTGAVALTVLPSLSSKTHIQFVKAKPTAIQVSTTIPTSALAETLIDNAIPAQRESSTTSQNQASSKSRASKTKTENDLTIIPKIDVYVSAAHLWADGATPAVVYVSLKAVKGNETWNYAPTEELVFQLEPRNALFSPWRVKVSPGAHTSEPASLIAKKPVKLAVTCTPERKYAGLAITSPDPETIAFIAPINAIGIESASASYQVNVAVPFEVFLYDTRDPEKTRRRPSSPISVQLISESGNGRIAAQPVQLTETEFSKFVHYVGTKTGEETIVASASYEGDYIRGITKPRIVFPLWIFLSGFAGSLLGSGMRYFRSSPSDRNKDFLESLFYGVVICIILLLYPVSTKLPDISNYVQPLLLFVLGALVSVYGPQSVHWALSFIPRGASQANG